MVVHVQFLKEPLKPNVKILFQGILSQVEFKSKALDGKWTVTGFPLETFETSPVSNPDLKTPAFYEGYFTLPEGKEPLDTFVDTTGWGKVL